MVKIVACDIQIQDSELYFLWYLSMFHYFNENSVVAPLTTFDVEKKKINKSLSLRPFVNQQYKGLLYNMKAKCTDRY